LPRALPNLPQPPGTSGGTWSADIARAHYDAERALEAIDWSKDDIYVWVPGTGSHNINPGFEAAVRDANKNGSASLSRIEYEASDRTRPSVATGIETLRLVLAGIQAHGGHHRVLVAGENQGSWVIGEALSDPLLKNVVTRAVIFGHPQPATHHYEDGHDPDVLEINHSGDEVSTPTSFGKLADALRAAVNWLIPGDYVKIPGNYRNDMTMAVEYLQTGRS
jgi:hypothetical protein